MSKSKEVPMARDLTEAEYTYLFTEQKTVSPVPTNLQRGSKTLSANTAPINGTFKVNSGCIATSDRECFHPS